MLFRVNETAFLKVFPVNVRFFVFRKIVADLCNCTLAPKGKVMKAYLDIYYK